MSQIILDADDVDEYVRERVDSVLVGKGTKSTVTLHIPDGEGDSICPYQTHREGGWRTKDFAVYPPGHHNICTTCVRERFGVEVER